MDSYPRRAADEPVYRGLRAARCIDASGRVTKDAYLRRPDKDIRGLSVAPAPVYAIMQIRPQGVAMIGALAVRQIEYDTETGERLDVVWNSEAHGNISGVPYYDPSDLRAIARAEYIADRLASGSLLLDDAQFQTAKRQKESILGAT